MADDIPNDLVPAEQAPQDNIPSDLVPAEGVSSSAMAAPIAPVSTAIPNDLVPVTQTSQAIPTPLFDRRRVQDVNDTDPEKQAYLSPEDVSAQNSAYADMYSAGQNKEIDSLKAAQAIKDKYPIFEKANVKDIQGNIDYYRAGGKNFPDYEVLGNKGLVVSKRQDPVSLPQAVGSSITDFSRGVVEGFSSLPDSLADSIFRGIAKLRGGDAPDKAEEVISDVEDATNNDYTKPTGWSRFGGNLLGGAVVYAPVAEVAPFAEMGPIGRLVDTTLQGGIVGGLNSGGKDIADNIAEGAALGAATHVGLSGLAGAVGLAGAKIPEAIADHFGSDGSFAGMKRLVFGTDNPKVTAQTFEPEFTNPQAPYAANRIEHLANIKAAIDDVTKGWENSPDFNIIGSSRNLTNLQKAELRAGGITKFSGNGSPEAWVGEDGRIHVIAGNIDDPSRIPAIVYHEVSGHIGLNKQFGKGLDDLLERIYSTNWRARQYADNYIQENPTVYQNDPSGAHIRATEEYLASQQEQGPQTLSNWEKVKQYVRDFGRNRLGMDLRYNDNDIKNILALSHKAATGDSGRVQLDGGRFMYAGERAILNNTEIKNYLDAQDLEKDGYDIGRASEARKNTRWFKGPDNLWRTEFSDHEAAFKKQGLNSLLMGDTAKLSDVINHPELFERYPHLKDVDVTSVTPKEISEGTRGWFDKNLNTLAIDPNDDNALSTILHEIQHSIQDYEGFSPGGNSATALNRYSFQALSESLQKFIKYYKDSKDYWDKVHGVAENIAQSPEFIKAKQAAQNLKDKTAALDRYDPNQIVHGTNGTKQRDTWAYQKAFTEKMDAYRALENANAVLWKKFGLEDHQLSSLDKSPKEWEIDDPRVKAIAKEIDSRVRDREPGYGSTSYKVIEAQKTINRVVKDMEDAIASGNKSEVIHQAQRIWEYDVKYAAYKNLFGEVEARDTQARQHLTPEQRRATRPYDGFDFANNHFAIGGERSVDPSYSQNPSVRPNEDNTHVDPLRDEDYTGSYHPINIRNPKTGEVVSAGRAYVDPETGVYQGSVLMHPLTKQSHSIDDETSKVIKSKLPKPEDSSARFSLRRNGTESLTRTGQDVARAVRDENKTTQTWEETEQKAANLGLTPGKLFKKNVFDAKPETAVAISNVVDSLVNKSSAIEERVARGEGTARDIQMQASALARAVHALEIFEGHKSDIARSLNILAALKDVPYDQLKDIDVGRLSNPKYVQDVTFKLNQYKNNPLARAQILKGISKGLSEDVFTGMHYDMMLSGLHTQSRNIFGQTSNLLADMLAAKPAGMILGHTSNVLKDLTGAGTKSDVMSLKEYGARWFGIMRSLADLGTWKQTAQSFQEMRPLSKTDQQYSTQTKNPIPYMDYGRRTLAAVDNLMHALMVNSDYYGAAVRDAEKSGKTGAAFWDHVDMKVKNPTDAMTKAANTYASDLSLIGKSDGVLAQAIDSITRAPSEEEYLRRAARFLVMLTVPWLRVPANAVRTMFESNLLTTGLSRNTRAAFSSEGSSIARQTAIAKATIGTALAGYFSYQYLQGNLRRNPQTYILEYKSGNQWHSMNGMDALNVIAGPAMAMTDAVKAARNKDAAQAWAGVINGFSGTVMSEGFGTQLSDLMEALNPRGAGALNRLATHQLQSWEPALGRDVARQMDPIVRDSNVETTSTDKLGRPVQERDWTKTLGNKLLENIPGQSQKLPPKLDINGQPVTRPTSLTGLFDTSPVDDDPVNKEIARLSEKTGKTIVNPARLLSTQGQADAGKKAHDIVSQMISSPVWDKIPDSKKIQLIDRQYSHARAAYRRIDKANAKSNIPSDLIPADLIPAN